MKFHLLHKSAYLLAGVLLTPALLSAAISLKYQECPKRAPIKASYSWNFKGEASQLLHKIQFQSMQIRDEVDSIRQLTRDPVLISWHAHADQLSQIQQQLNVMANEMCRLQTIRRMTYPWQQKAIARIQPAMIELANYTAKALTYTEREGMANYASPVYTGEISDMYTAAGRITRTTNDFMELAKAHQDLKQLGHVAKSSVG